MRDGIRFVNSRIRINIYWLIALYINLDLFICFLTNLFIIAFQRTPVITSGYFLLPIVMIAVAYMMVVRRINSRFIIVVVSFLLLYLLSVVLTPEITAILGRAFVKGIMYVIFVAYVMSNVDDHKKLLERLVPYVYIALALAVSQILLPQEFKATRYMAFSYSSMLPMLTAFSIGVYGDAAAKGMGRKFALFSFLFLLFMNLINGGRGSLLCVMIYVLFLIHFQAPRRKAVYIILLIAAALTLYLFFDSIVAYLLRLFPNSRTLLRIQDNELLVTESSARAIMWKAILENFIKDPLPIRGFLSDRLFVSELFPESDTIYGWYSHSFVLEQVYQFGLLSIPMLILEGVAFVRKINYAAASGDVAMKCVISVSFAFFLGQMMVSSSYLVSESFGIVLGLLIHNDNMKRSCS